MPIETSITTEHEVAVGLAAYIVTALRRLWFILDDAHVICRCANERMKLTRHGRINIDNVDYLNELNGKQRPTLASLSENAF
jgi:hypothetical protein